MSKTRKAIIKLLENAFASFGNVTIVVSERDKSGRTSPRLEHRWDGQQPPAEELAGSLVEGMRQLADVDGEEKVFTLKAQSHDATEDEAFGARAKVPERVMRFKVLGRPKADEAEGAAEDRKFSTKVSFGLNDAMVVGLASALDGCSDVRSYVYKLAVSEARRAMREISKSDREMLDRMPSIHSRFDEA